MTDRRSEYQKKTEYTDEEINELADWLAELTLKQAFFLKESYEAMMLIQAKEYGGNEYVH